MPLEDIFSIILYWQYWILGVFFIYQLFRKKRLFYFFLTGKTKMMFWSESSHTFSSCEYTISFTHFLQGCFTGTGAIIFQSLCKGYWPVWNHYKMRQSTKPALILWDATTEDEMLIETFLTLYISRPIHGTLNWINSHAFRIPCPENCIYMYPG